MTIIETISRQVPNTKEGKEYLQLWLKSKEGNEFVAVDWYEDHHGITMSETVWLEGYGRGNDKNAPTVEATPRRTEYVYCKECIYNMNWVCTMKNEKIKPTTLCLYGKKKRGGNNDKRK